jgi:hypothetical protein
MKIFVIMDIFFSSGEKRLEEKALDPIQIFMNVLIKNYLFIMYLLGVYLLKFKKDILYKKVVLMNVIVVLLIYFVVN